MNTKLLAKMICEILRSGIPQYGLDKIPQWSAVEDFCEERANNLAQAMPALLEECEYSQTSVVGVEPGDSDESPMKWRWRDGVRVLE